MARHIKKPRRQLTVQEIRDAVELEYLRKYGIYSVDDFEKIDQKALRPRPKSKPKKE